MENKIIDSTDIDYNVNSPTEKNIKFVFSDLLFNLIGAINFKPYEKHKIEYEEILQRVQKWVSTYVNTKLLETIDPEEIEETFNETLILKDKLFMADEWFQEAIHQDIESLRLLRANQIINKEEEKKNGKR